MSNPISKVMTDEHDDFGRPGRPAAIRATHLAKVAVVYVRQSTPEQVRENTGSTETQRGLASVARTFGWPEQRILIKDGDLGLSGKYSDNRTAFQEVLGMMERGEVGIVLIQDTGRMSRNPLDSERFLEVVRRTGTLVFAGGRLFDPSNAELPELFGLRIEAILAWYENEHRVQRFKDARVAKAQNGHAVTRPPIGYVQSVKGKWIKDPNQSVQDAVARLFTLYQQLGSLNAVRKYLRHHGLLFPSRRRGEIHWKQIGRSQLEAILKNPNYSGDYVFQQQKAVPANSRGKRGNARRPQSEWIRRPDHHDPYVTRTDWETIQASLAANRPSVRPPRGKGPALLQGLVQCGECSRWMKTQYSGRKGPVRVASYCCRPVDADGRPTHSHFVAASLVDGPVVQAVLRALTPASLEEALAAINSDREQRVAVDKGRSRLLQQAQDAVEEARRRYRHVDPEHHMVKMHLEAELEAALRQLKEVTWKTNNRPAGEHAILDEDNAVELIQLTQNVEGLWNATLTSNEDRKRLLQTVISAVVVHRETVDHVDLEIVWAGGLREVHRVFRPRGIQRLAAELKVAGHGRTEIIERLKADGLWTLNGRADTQGAIAQRAHKLGLGAKSEWPAAVALIRRMVMEGQQRREMLEALRGTGAPDVGDWDYPRLARVIRGLKRGPIGSVPALPPVTPADEMKAEVIETAHERRSQGTSWPAIAEELNSAGLRPEMAARFTSGLVSRLVKDHDARGGVPRKRGRPRPRRAAQSVTGASA